MPCHELFIHTFQGSLQAVGMKRYSLTSGSWTTARENHNEAQNCAKCTIHSTLLHGERQPGLGSWGRCQQVAVPELGHRKELEFDKCCLLDRRQAECRACREVQPWKWEARRRSAGAQWSLDPAVLRRAKVRPRKAQTGMSDQLSGRSSTRRALL